MKARRSESGNALIMGMATLLVLTLLGVSSIDSAILEQRMANSSMNHAIAFQNAENGLLAMEKKMVTYSSFTTLLEYLTANNLYFSSKTTGHLDFSSWTAIPVFFHGVFNASASAVDGEGNGLNKIMVEHLSLMYESSEGLNVGSGNKDFIKRYYLRVTSLGTGPTYKVANAASGDTPRHSTILQSVMLLDY
ncbi:MAG: hypothetical protein KAG53_08325 [Endozoicomonadaceae bacterium]|nr:hypothetical protein [Endozoicomonadaceae bacterium]